MLDKSTGEGVIRTKEKLDCELQKEHTFTIQAYDCGEGPDGANMKKSHKYVELCAGFRKRVESHSGSSSAGGGERMLLLIFLHCRPVVLCWWNQKTCIFILIMKL